MGLEIRSLSLGIDQLGERGVGRIRPIDGISLLIHAFAPFSLNRLNRRCCCFLLTVGPIRKFLFYFETGLCTNLRLPIAGYFVLCNDFRPKPKSAVPKYKEHIDLVSLSTRCQKSKMFAANSMHSRYHHRIYFVKKNLARLSTALNPPR